MSAKTQTREDHRNKRNGQNNGSNNGKGNKGNMIWMPVATGLAFLVRPELAETAAWLMNGWKIGHIPATPAPHPKEMVKVVLTGDQEYRLENIPEVVLRFALGTHHYAGTSLFSAYITEDGKHLQLVQGTRPLKSFERSNRVRPEDILLVTALARAARMPDKDIDELVGRARSNGNAQRIKFPFQVDPEKMTLAGIASFPEAVKFEVYVWANETRGELKTSAMADANGVANISFVCVYEESYAIVAFDKDGKELGTPLLRTPHNREVDKANPLEISRSKGNLSYELVGNEPLVAHIKATCEGAVAWAIRIDATDASPLGVAGGTGSLAEAWVTIKYDQIFDVVFTLADGTEVRSELGAFDGMGGSFPPVEPVEGVNAYATHVVGNVIGTGLCNGAKAWVITPAGKSKPILAKGEGPYAQFSFVGAPGEYTIGYSVGGKKVDIDANFTVAELTETK